MKDAITFLLDSNTEVTIGFISKDWLHITVRDLQNGKEIENYMKKKNFFNHITYNTQ